MNEMYNIRYNRHVRTASPKEIRILKEENGNEPFSVWITALKDVIAKAKIAVRLDRVALGNMGDCKPVGDGVSELRVDYGPGYRIYIVEHGEIIVVLICGGTKRTQKRDIKKAKDLWEANKNAVNEF